MPASCPDQHCSEQLLREPELACCWGSLCWGSLCWGGDSVKSDTIFNHEEWVVREAGGLGFLICCGIFAQVLEYSSSCDRLA